MNPEKFLQTLINNERILKELNGNSFTIDGIKNLLGFLKNPQDSLKIIHIAGSKGKGSTAALISHILSAAGFKVGLYTSPHLYNYRERIRILADEVDYAEKGDLFPGQISSEDLWPILSEIEHCMTEHNIKDLTFFEVLTAAAFCYFQKKKTDFVVLETGLGGRLDATNVCSSMISVVTSIGLEHQNILGDTLESIAREKSEIIKKSNAIAIVAPQTEGVKEIILERAKQENVNIHWVEDEVWWEVLWQEPVCQVLDLEIMGRYIPCLKLVLRGNHQAENLAVAVSVINTLDQMGYSVFDAHIRYGAETAFWPVRFEIGRENPLVVLDGAHTKEAASRLAETFQKIFPENDAIVVLGVSLDKDIKGICHELSILGDHFILTKAQHDRAYQFTQEDAAQKLPDKKCQIINPVPEAVSQALIMAGDRPILVAGSLFVAAEARKYLFEN